MRTVVLVALFVMFAASAAAVTVNPNGPAGVAAVWRFEYGTTPPVWVLATSGELWRLEVYPAARWVRGCLNESNPAELDPPVPVSQLAEWWLFGCITQSGDVWEFIDQSWQQVPAPPFAPVPAEQKSLGAVKRGYR